MIAMLLQVDRGRVTCVLIVARAKRDPVIDLSGHPTVPAHTWTSPADTKRVSRVQDPEPLDDPWKAVRGQCRHAG